MMWIDSVPGSSNYIYHIAGKFGEFGESSVIFTKLKPSKFLLKIITFWLNLFIRETFSPNAQKE